MIDSHCHLADRGFSKDLPSVISRAISHGVTTMVTIADSLDEAKMCRSIAEKNDHIFYTVGVHPHNASQWNDRSTETLKELLKSPKAVAIGEIGLDYHYDNSPRDVQRSVFATQLHLAKELDLPVVVHNRESIDDLRNIIQENPPPTMVLHCCTEEWNDVKDLVAQGYLLSFTGIATYKNSTAIRDTIKHCPLTQMMVETDAPYLAPQTKRGQRNEPAFVVEVAKLIAEIKGVSLAEVDAQTTANAVEFYRLPS